MHYIGSRIISTELLELNDTFAKTSKEHFEAFKRVLRNKGIGFEELKDSRANVIKVCDKYIYFQGGNVWWGFSKNVICQLFENKRNNIQEIYLVMRSVDKQGKNERYFAVKLKSPQETPVKKVKGRYIISLNGNDILNSPGDIIYNINNVIPNFSGGENSGTI